MSNTTGSIGTNMTDSWIGHVTNTTLDVATNMALNVTMSATDVNTTITHANTTVASDTSSQQFTTTPYSHDAGFEYVYYMYTGFSFEKPVYLYIWEILVILTSIVNIVVVSILLRRKMRNPTNMVLAAIAISDSLTGLTTLPTYIMVYQSTGQQEYEYPQGSYEGHEPYPEGYAYSDPNYNPLYAHYYNGNSSYDMPEVIEFEVYYLSKDLCRWFMITKLFISKTFHSISICLTLFLGIQRFISVAAPFKAQALTTQRAILICIAISVMSPILHVFHLTDEKAEHGMCEWDLEESGCTGGCIELWIMFVIRNFIPCGVLLLFTILFIRELHKGEVSIRRMGSNKGQIARRVVENRRIAFIVTSIVIVFLIPEIPYGFYLLYNAIDKTAYNGVHMDLKTNRAVHMTYEILLVLSFHANFYIYTLFNRKFRTFLIKIFVQPVRRFMGDKRRVSVSSSGSQKTDSQRTSQRKTELISMKSNPSTHPLKKALSNTLSKDTVESAAFMNSVSVDITQTSHQDKDDELEALNANV